MDDPFQILGLNYVATIDDVSRRFRELSKLVHPDRVGGNKATFAKLQQAYDIVVADINSINAEEVGNSSIASSVALKTKVLRAALIAANELHQKWDTILPSEPEQLLARVAEQAGNLEGSIEAWYRQTRGVLYEMKYHESNAVGLESSGVTETLSPLGLVEGSVVAQNQQEQKATINTEAQHDQKATINTEAQHDQKAKTDTEAQHDQKANTDTEAQHDQKAKTDTEAQHDQKAKTDTETPQDQKAKTDTETPQGQKAKTDTETPQDQKATSNLLASSQSLEQACSVPTPSIAPGNEPRDNSKRRFRRPHRNRREVPTKCLHICNTGPVFNITVQNIECSIRDFLDGQQGVDSTHLDCVIVPKASKPFVVACFFSSMASQAVVQNFDRKLGDGEPLCNRVVACSYAEELLDISSLVPTALHDGSIAVGDAGLSPLQLILRLQESIMKSSQTDESGLLDMTSNAQDGDESESSSDLFVCPLCRAEFNQVRSLRMHLTSPAKHALSDAAAITTAVRISRYESHQLQQQLKAMGMSDANASKQKTNSQNMSPKDVIRLRLLEHVKQGNVESLRQTFKENPDIDPSSPLDDHGSTALHWAAGGGFLEVCKLLVDELGVPASQECVWGRKNRRNALHWSSRNNQVHVMNWLVHEKGLDINSTTNDGTHSFAWAVWQHHFLAARWLIANGADWMKVNDWGCNAIHWAAVTGNLPMCQWLYDSGLDITVCNTQGHSALHKAAYGGHRHVCKWLLTQLPKDFQPSNVDNGGYSASLIASERGHHDLATWLDSWSTAEQLNDVEIVESLRRSVKESRSTCKNETVQASTVLRPTGPLGKLEAIQSPEES